MLRAILRNAGLNPRKLTAALRGWHRYKNDRQAFRKLDGSSDMPWARELPILTEWAETSAMLGAYFFQDLLVARWVRSDAPVRHVDVGSRIDGFIGHLAVFREVEVIDIRPAPTVIPNVIFHQLALMEDLDSRLRDSAESLSCLHTIEHFGLGRYGDPLDPRGHLKGLAQLKRMVKPGGLLYLSTPIGCERLEFNAHRIFAPQSMLSWFADGWVVERSAVIDDSLSTHESAGPEVLANASCNAGVGIICARKIT